MWKAGLKDHRINEMEIHGALLVLGEKDAWKTKYGILWVNF